MPTVPPQIPPTKPPQRAPATTHFENLLPSQLPHGFAKVLGDSVQFLNAIARTDFVALVIEDLIDRVFHLVAHFLSQWMVAKVFVVFVVIPDKKPQFVLDSLVLCCFGKMLVQDHEIVDAFPRQSPRESLRNHYHVHKTTLVPDVVVAISYVCAKGGALPPSQALRQDISEDRNCRMAQNIAVSQAHFVVLFVVFLLLLHGLQLHH
mmetsp:Transcript_22584/g.55961  ORF Transcript_22584/g.55961 Transcript_22584/m.55961 type:complete len:206 (+) Transcript_22584:3712-4329(+)